MIYRLKCGILNKNNIEHCYEYGNKLNFNMNNLNTNSPIIWLGRFSAILFSPLGIIIGLYLINQDDRKIKNVGWIMLIVSILVIDLYISLFFKFNY